MLEKKEARRYAQAHRRIELGVWGHKKSLFFAIHLTTREGDDVRLRKYARAIEIIECGIKQ